MHINSKFIIRKRIKYCWYKWTLKVIIGRNKILWLIINKNLIMPVSFSAFRAQRNVITSSSLILSYP